MNLLRLRLLHHQPNRRWDVGIRPASDPTADLHHGGVAVTLPGQPWSLLVTRAGADVLRVRPLALRSRAVTNRYRVENRWRDLRASLAGYCNDRPYRGEPGLGGGYAHWRCALAAGHPGLHRARNYVWDADGQTSFLPLPPGQSADQPWERHHVHTRSQARESERWHRRRGRQARAEGVSRA